MATRLITLDPNAPDAGCMREVADALRRGALVSFPTDTVYALGCDAGNANAARRVFEAKGRAPKHPLILLGHDAASLFSFGRSAAAAAALAARFWPGPLTLVVPLAVPLPAEATAGGQTIGLRVPDHPVALELLAAHGAPLATTSANRSGERDPVTAKEVADGLGDTVEIILDGGPSPLGVASTVLDLTREPATILRRGTVSVEGIGEVIGHVIAEERPD